MNRNKLIMVAFNGDGTVNCFKPIEWNDDEEDITELLQEYYEDTVLSNNGSFVGAVTENNLKQFIECLKYLEE